MTNRTKNQSFLATSPRKYFKVGLAISLALCIGAFYIPLYSKVIIPHTHVSGDEEDIVYITEIIPIKEVEKIEKKEKKVEVVQANKINTTIEVVDDTKKIPEEKPVEQVLEVSDKTKVALVEPVKPAAPSKPLSVVEIMPEFKGGEAAMFNYFNKNIKYPQPAIDVDESGKVFVKFIINEDGSISDVEIAKGVFYALDNEALRIVKSMPSWSPGIQNGMKVKVKMVVPINFVLE